jgi:hypothetical protein
MKEMLPGIQLYFVRIFRFKVQLREKIEEVLPAFESVMVGKIIRVTLCKTDLIYVI